MENFTLKLHALNFMVEDLRASIDFYKRLGFYVQDTGSTMKTVSAYLKLSQDSDLRICLTQSLTKEELKLEPFWIEFEPECEEDEYGSVPYEVAFDGLLSKGIKYENLKPSEVGVGIIGTALMRDPDGVSLHLVSDNWDEE